MVVENANAGVDGSTGYTFQKCCAIHLLLENHESLKDRDYFLFIEHYDDFLFAFCDPSGHLIEVEAYQAKKGAEDWSTDKELADIVRKLTIVGNNLINDPIPKLENYIHNLHFITNRSINLTCGNRGKGALKVKVYASNTSKKYCDLALQIQNNLCSKFEQDVQIYINELDNITFKYLDLPARISSIKDQLVGSARRVLHTQVNDHVAVVDTLLQLLLEKETTYNNAGNVCISDPSKRLEKKEIDGTFNMLIANSKAFDFWRNNANSLSKGLRISVSLRKNAKELLDNCFDYFKDIQQVEYKNIYNFVESTTKFDDISYLHEECIQSIYEHFLVKKSSKLEKHMIAFAVIAAYVETRNIND